MLRSRPVRRVFARLTHPGPALALYVAATWLWHVPAVYEAALRSAGLHYLQHACFLGSSLLFWYPVVRPYPARPRWSPWLLLPYLLLADVSNTVLSALLTFSDRVLYPHYGQVPRLAGISALDDQAAAGVIMWVPGSVAFLLPLFAIGIRLLFGERRDGPSRPEATGRSTARSRSSRLCGRPPPPRRASTCLRLPILGPIPALATCPARGPARHRRAWPAS